MMVVLLPVCGDAGIFSGNQWDELVGLPTCPCIDDVPIPWHGDKDCIPVLGRNIHPLLFGDEEYCYPTDYGRTRCDAWDVYLLPDCANPLKGVDVPEHVHRLDKPVTDTTHRLQAPAWCDKKWCYVDPNNCDEHFEKSTFFPDVEAYFSYETCRNPDLFAVHGLPTSQLCAKFGVVEKPVYIMFISCLVCAVLQQAIDAVKGADTRDELSFVQKAYCGVQLCTLIRETYRLIQAVDWFAEDASFWQSYNLYVYAFIHSSVFVRSVMMSMIVLDWYSASLLLKQVMWFDGKGYSDEHRMVMLILIFQFCSSAGIFGFILFTHLVPGIICYFWLFFLIVGLITKFREHVPGLLRLDKRGSAARAIMMASDSFIACLGFQFLSTSMVRVYSGQWSSGYLFPLYVDFKSRRADIWLHCHLGDPAKGITNLHFKDQDFLNLFAR